MEYQFLDTFLSVFTNELLALSPGSTTPVLAAVMPILPAWLCVPGWDVLSGRSTVLMQGNGKQSCVLVFI